MANKATNLYQSEENKAKFDLLVPGYQNLLAGVLFMPGQGVLTRGAVVFLDGNLTYKEATAAEVVDSRQLAVLNEDVDTGTESTGVAVVGAVIQSGVLIREALKIKGASTVSAANELALRKQGINLSSHIKADGTYATVDNEI